MLQEKIIEECLIPFISVATTSFMRSPSTASAVMIPASASTFAPTSTPTPAPFLMFFLVATFVPVTGLGTLLWYLHNDKCGFWRKRADSHCI